MIDERYTAARVAALYGVARTAYATSLAAGGLLVAILWHAVEHALLVGWFVLLAAVTAARLGVHVAYRRGGASPAAGPWERRFAAGALAAGLAWMIPPLLLFPENAPFLQMAVVFVGGGSVIGAAGIYAASPAAFYAFCLPPIAGVVVALALQPGEGSPLVALLMLLFGGAMVRVYRDIHRYFAGALRAKSEKEALLERAARSEAQLRDAIESFPEGIALWDAEDRLLVCNETYAKVYGGGRAAAGLPGTPYRAIAENAFEAEVVPAEYATHREAWIEARLERRRRGDGGAVRHYALRDGRALQGRFVRGGGGGVVSAFTDVTALRRAQDAYDRLRAEETLMLDTLPVGIAFFSGRVIERCNRRLETMLGYGPGELTGKSTRILYPSEAHWVEAGERYKLMRSGDVLEGEFRLRRKDGSELWCRAVGRAIDPRAPEASVVVTYNDTSERHAAERALRKSESLYRNLVETSNDLIWSVDAAGRWTYLSPAATRRIYGCEPRDILGREFRELLAQEVADRDLAVFARILNGESIYDYQTRHRRLDGGHVDLSFNVVPLRDARGNVIGATGTARDVTAEKLAAAQQYENVEKLRLAVDAAQLTYWELERDTGAIYWGRDPGAPPGAGTARTGRWADFLASVHPEDRDRYAAAVEAAWEQAGAYSIEYRYVHADGRVAWMASHGRTASQAGGRIHRMIGVTQEITERKRQEEEARFLAYHDTLTGLPNRRLLDDRLRQAVYVAQRRGGRVAVMVIDLDRFKQVNDALGHRAGDAVLREAAHRIAACVRKADTVARHGGDEFVVVVPDLAQEGDSQVVAEKILRALEPPFRVDGRDFSIGASIGISLCPNDAGDGDAALRNADAAMYRAKQLGRNNYRYFGR